MMTLLIMKQILLSTKKIKKQYYDELIKEHKFGDMSPNEDIYILICKNKKYITINKKMKYTTLLFLIDLVMY